MNPFSLNNYPKQFASINQNDYRLQAYLNKSNDELNILFHDLENFCITRAETFKPVRIYKNLAYIGSGWEYSVFRLSDSKVVKIPAEIFPEVNTDKYLENSQLAYQAVLRYFGKELTAETHFVRENDLNTLEQEYIQGEISPIISLNESDKTLLHNIQNFCKSAKKIIEEIEWIPDIDLRKTDSGFILKNCIIQQSTSLPKIIDTTYYLDQNRMYPQLKTDALDGMTKRIEEFTEWLEVRVKD